MTLYTSDIDIPKKSAKTAFVYLLVGIFCAFFGAVYELFSHEVYSYYMIYAFAFPLLGGTLPFLVICLTHPKHYPNAVARNIYHAGIATLTVGSIIRGVLDIYGTTNILSEIYWYAGFALVFTGVFTGLIEILLHNREYKIET